MVRRRGRERRLHRGSGHGHHGVDSVGAGRAGDVGDRVVGSGVRGRECGVSIVSIEFRRRSEVRVPVRGRVSRVAHIQDCRVAVVGRQLAGRVERGLTVALRKRPTSPSTSTTAVVRTIGRVLGTYQVLQRREILYFSSASDSPIILTGLGGKSVV